MDLVKSTHPTRLDLDTLSQLAGDFLYILFVYFCWSSSLSTIFHTVAGNARPSIYLIAPFSPTCWIGVSLQGSNLHIPDHAQKSRVSFISEVMKRSLETAFIQKSTPSLATFTNTNWRNKKRHWFLFLTKFCIFSRHVWWRRCMYDEMAGEKIWKIL